MEDMIAIVDYGLGNLGSIKNMLDRIRVDAAITSDPKELMNADKLILPGVGAFDNGMEKLDTLGLLSVLNMRVMGERIPILGICLGMQLFTLGSEEGSRKGLGWIEADTKRFQASLDVDGLRIPHMGWNSAKLRDSADPLVSGIGDEPKFYFVHSYYVEPRSSTIALATTDYGVTFASMIHKDNIYGVQFHPEKSHKYGMQLLHNFAIL
jgi:glutamine amidotransferase